MSLSFIANLYQRHEKLGYTDIDAVKNSRSAHQVIACFKTSDTPRISNLQEDNSIAHTQGISITRYLLTCVCHQKEAHGKHISCQGWHDVRSPRILPLS